MKAHFAIQLGTLIRRDPNIICGFGEWFCLWAVLQWSLIPAIILHGRRCCGEEEPNIINNHRDGFKYWRTNNPLATVDRNREPACQSSREANVPHQLRTPRPLAVKKRMNILSMWLILSLSTTTAWALLQTHTNSSGQECSKEFMDHYKLAV